MRGFVRGLIVGALLASTCWVKAADLPIGAAEVHDIVQALREIARNTDRIADKDCSR